MPKFGKGDPFAKGSSAYMRSIAPPEPQLNLNLNDPAHVKQFVNYDPDPVLANTIFTKLHDPCASLASIACDHDITLETLTAWLARPDIAERLTNLEGACAMRLRLNTISRLHLALEACTTILSEYNDSACHEAGLREGKGFSAKEHNRRDRETARKTSLLMLRLATFDPTKPRRHSRDPRSGLNPNAQTEVQHIQSRTGAAPIITNTTAHAHAGYSITFAAPGFEQPTDPTTQPLPNTKYSTIEATATELPTQPTPDIPSIGPIAPIGPIGPIASASLFAAGSIVAAAQAAQTINRPEHPVAAEQPPAPEQPLPSTTAPSSAREAGSRCLPDAPASGTEAPDPSSPVKRASELPNLTSTSESNAAQNSESSRSWGGERHTLSPGREARIEDAPTPEPAERAPQNTPESHSRPDPQSATSTPHTNHGNPARLNE